VLQTEPLDHPADERVIYVGDIHGCIDEFQALLRVLRVSKSDALVLVGDLVAKGPDSQAVVQAARELGAQAVRGNHDQRVLDYKKAPPSGPIKAHHLQVLDTLSDAEFAWLDALPYAIRMPAQNVLVVHAGVVPSLPLAEQNPRDVITMRALKPDGTASTRASEGVLWATKWHGPEEIVFGHDAVRGLQHHPHAIGLDTGCCYGRDLTAYLLPERRLVSVRAKNVYNTPKNGS
jgi:diadenosine tetraphosphatase ApaH/serine/threonine PP2A family protein phosphatase